MRQLPVILERYILLDDSFIKKDNVGFEINFKKKTATVKEHITIEIIEGKSFLKNEGDVSELNNYTILSYLKNYNRNI